MKYSISLIIWLCFICNANSQSVKSIAKGRWIGSLALNNTDTAHFELIVKKNKNEWSLHAANGHDIVPFDKPILQNDSIVLKSTYFNTKFVVARTSKKSLEGKWVSQLKNYVSIPFKAIKSKKSLFSINEKREAEDFSGTWKTTFNTKGKSFPALGYFNQEGNHITGTFATETGDFRFLSGNVDGNNLYLSGFDASHVYLFKGTKNGNELKGTFSSGKTYKTDWIAEKSDTFYLERPESITTVVGNPYQYSLELENLDGSPFLFPHPDYKEKVVILQIMGTWCANCMDETIFFKELYEKYHSKGLEIITIGYEHNEAKEHLLEYQKNFDIKNRIVLGGDATKSSAKKDFYFLSDISSFPTSLIIDRQGKIVHTHTGFYGPSTGEKYEEYKQSMEKIIEQLLNQSVENK